MLEPLITSVEGIPEGEMNDLDFINRQVVVYENEIIVEAFIDNELNLERLHDCNDSYTTILVTA